jgi:hypothetical protein
MLLRNPTAIQRGGRKLWYHGNYGLLNEKLHAVLCSKTCRGEKIIEAIDQAAQSGEFDPWRKKVDADIDAGRVKPLNELLPAIEIV